jgi:alginate O-acetyltransferase complex protein AlgI
MVTWLSSMGVCLIVNWLAGIALGKVAPRGGAAKLILGATLFICLGLLFYFKYANFFLDVSRQALGLVGVSSEFLSHPLKVIMPLGISFYTFHCLSYSIDVYRGTIVPTKNLLEFATYLTMFPQLIAGPIVRYSTVFKQLSDRSVRAVDVEEGIKRFLIGAFKKVLIANPLAVPVDAIFALPSNELSFELCWLGTICYTLQIYFDFSAYSDMAIGLARLMGFHFLENFNYPYISQSIKEFWRRWHISLSTWFRDYLYIPLGGSRGAPWRTYLNLWIIFLVCGLWHGANWTFLIWGAYHGGFLVIERLGLESILARVPRFFRHTYAVVTIMCGWVFFRAETLQEAIQFLKYMFVVVPAAPNARVASEFFSGVPKAAMVAGTLIATGVPLSIVTKMSAEIENRGGSVARIAWRSVSVVGVAMGCVLVWMSLISGSYNPFIYYRF